MRRRTIVRLGGATLGLVALLLGGSAMAAEPEKPSPVLVAKVTKVNDGDSIQVDLSSGLARVRLSAIDTPEFDQPYGSQASAALKSMLPVGATVELEVETQDSFNRIVATVWLVANGNRTNLNEAMLRDGHAWAYRRYMKNPRYCDIEQEARARKAGLWAQPVNNWVYPPEWRYLKDGDIRVLPTPYEETRETCLAVLGLAGKGTYTPPK
jgi:micrococcal nuclease